MWSKRRIALAALAACAAGVVALNWTWGRLPAEPRPRGSLVTLGDVRVHVHERAGRGPAVVLLHGLPGTAADFDAVVARLPGRRTLALDRPGFGFSDGGHHPLDAQLATIARLLDARGIARPVLVGHSYGAALALAFAARHPRRVRRLVLVAPVAGGHAPRDAQVAQAHLARLLSLPVVQPVADATFSQATRTLTARREAARAFAPDPVDPVYEDRLVRVAMRHDDLDAYAGELLALDDVLPRLGPRRLRRIDVPAVVVHGRDDRLVDVAVGRRIAAALPRGRLRLVPGGHMVPHVRPDAVAAAVGPPAAAGACRPRDGRGRMHAAECGTHRRLHGHRRLRRPVK